jgi:hypothetical protein
LGDRLRAGVHQESGAAVSAAMAVAEWRLGQPHHHSDPGARCRCDRWSRWGFGGGWRPMVPRTPQRGLSSCTCRAPAWPKTLGLQKPAAASPEPAHEGPWAPRGPSKRSVFLHSSRTSLAADPWPPEARWPGTAPPKRSVFLHSLRPIPPSICPVLVQQTSRRPHPHTPQRPFHLLHATTNTPIVGHLIPSTPHPQQCCWIPAESPKRPVLNGAKIRRLGKILGGGIFSGGG